MTTISNLLADARAWNERAFALARDASLLAAQRDELAMQMRGMRWRVKDINGILGTIRVEHRIPAGEPTAPAEPEMDIQPRQIIPVAHQGPIDPFEIPSEPRRAPPKEGE